VSSDESLLNDSSQRTPGKKKSRSCAIHRLVQLWAATGRRHIINGIIDSSGNIQRRPRAQIDALRDAWAPTFASRPFDASGSEDFLQQHAVPYDFSDTKPPCKHDYAVFLSEVVDSSSGPDGIPFSAWHAAEDHGTDLLYEIGETQYQGLGMPITFNDSLAIFPPKGDVEGDETEILRSAENTRPLGMKNTDNKAVTAVFTRSFRSAMKRSTHHTQRGFVPDRQLLHNVIDLDTAGRIFAAKALLHNDRKPCERIVRAVLAFFDFSAAFPSMFHGWIHATVKSRNFPVGARNFLKCLFACNGGFARIENELFFYIGTPRVSYKAVPLPLFALIFP